MNNEKVNEIKNEVIGTFNLLQRLEMPVNENNIAIMNSSLCSLKWIMNELEKLKEPQKGVAKNGNSDTK